MFDLLIKHFDKQTERFNNENRTFRSSGPGSNTGTGRNKGGQCGSVLLPVRPEMQLGELLALNRGRGIGERAGGLLGLGEGDHVADGAGPGEHHHQAVEAKGNAAVRGRAEFQGAEEEAELLLCLFLFNAQHFEQPRLHFRAVDADRAAADLAAVKDKVVGPAAHPERFAFQQLKVFLKGRGEGMVQGNVAFALAVVLH